MLEYWSAGGLCIQLSGYSGLLGFLGQWYYLVEFETCYYVLFIHFPFNELPSFSIIL
jgi:hypothetical protein